MNVQVTFTGYSLNRYQRQPFTPFLSIANIQRRVADCFGIREAEMHSARRSREVARPRQIAMYLARQLTPRSYPEIGRRFGGRDHTTVMHAVRQIEKFRREDPDIARVVQYLIDEIGGQS